MRLTKKEIEKDHEILGAIIAGSKEKPLMRGARGIERTTTSCAVGAGNIGRKVNKARDVFSYENGSINKFIKEVIPAKRFAEVNEVSLNYVAGINDGFENRPGAAQRIFHAEAKMTSKDYYRGWCVGSAAFSYSES